ncbi:hypothetical protein SAMD00019534_025300 [Acytostelium subglobosum LB1]|uniref:hypothetical protein n=1 Tax=Acytostelium subglobosum LB1 TaxID=1410327 RepID=UPI000644B732|nr:hypothetical protein SAMD00019534_025300 [Acytostelium subglobosum LB1]GAM19355.1 hypothetical protein SAMD00019534_025300 [Acytostelium subglobosum LB1]|eukprot:XP_012757282.1 hypothetical protein SAMD00019534_025300 [Acytostelium subglobosum LB1]
MSPSRQPQQQTPSQPPSLDILRPQGMPLSNKQVPFSNVIKSPSPIIEVTSYKEDRGRHQVHMPPFQQTQQPQLSQPQQPQQPPLSQLQQRQPFQQHRQTVVSVQSLQLAGQQQQHLPGIRVQGVRVNKVSDPSFPLDLSQLSNQFFTIGTCGSHVFDMATNLWYQFDDRDDKDKRFHPLNSVVSYGENIYVFGGSNKSHTYSIYSTRSLKCMSFNDIGTGRGGASIATCFDGQRYIYMVGGYNKDTYLRRVDRFDIETLEFVTIGELTLPVCQALVFLHNRDLYVVGGRNEKGEVRQVQTFNLEARLSGIFLEDIEFAQSIITSCFDGVDLIYIMDNESEFFTISLKTRTKTVLNSPFSAQPLSSKYSMVHFNSSSTNIAFRNLELVFFIGGKTYGNLIYIPRANHWIPVKDTDDVIRQFDGAAQIKII